jgi:hypothetical protein
VRKLLQDRLKEAIKNGRKKDYIKERKEGNRDRT